MLPSPSNARITSSGSGPAFSVEIRRSSAQSTYPGGGAGRIGAFSSLLSRPFRISISDRLRIGGVRPKTATACAVFSHRLRTG